MFNVPQLLSIFYFKRLMPFNVLEIVDVDTFNYLIIIHANCLQT